MLVINPAAGPGRKRARMTALAERAERLIPGLTVRFTEGPGHATELAREAARNHLPKLFAAGGDGTINEALQGLVGSATALCPVPAGTGNVVARELRLPNHPEAALKEVLRRSVHPVTVGLAEGDGYRRHFLLMFGVGIDSAVIADLQSGTKAGLGIGAYFLQGGLTLARYRFPPIRVGDNGHTHTGTSVVIANGANYAGGFTLNPDAGLTRPDLNLLVMQGQSPLSYGKYALGVLAHCHTRMRGIHSVNGRRFTIESDTPMRGHLDGELTCLLPLTLSALPEGVLLPLPDHGPTGANHHKPTLIPGTNT